SMSFTAGETSPNWESVSPCWGRWIDVGGVRPREESASSLKSNARRIQSFMASFGNILGTLLWPGRETAAAMRAAGSRISSALLSCPCCWTRRAEWMWAAISDGPICEPLIVQHLLEDDQVVSPIRVPADADHVVAQGDGQMKHRTVLVMAFETNGLVLVLFRPLVDGVHELRGDPLSPEIRDHSIKPGEKHRRLQLKTEEESDRAIINPSDQLQNVVPASVPPNE